MSASRNGHYVICPLCEGKGRLHRSEFISRLANHEVEARLTACRQALVQPDSEPEAGTETKTFHEEVVKGPATRMLWRRSHKE